MAEMNISGMAEMNMCGVTEMNISGMAKMNRCGLTKIKICGLTRAEEIAYVNEARPDYCGFVINVPWSRRSVSPGQARALAGQLAEGIVPVGVFADAPPEEVAALLETGAIGMAQLHGGESPGYIARLRELTGRPLIQAFRIGTEEDAAAAQASPADYVLLDAGAGGGRAFDWRLAETVSRPFFLAGGLGPANVRDAIAAARPFAVDMSSGVETNGRKDREKILAAVAAARGQTCGENR